MWYSITFLLEDRENSVEVFAENESKAKSQFEKGYMFDEILSIKEIK
jgi:hypothetical protein